MASLKTEPEGFQQRRPRAGNHSRFACDVHETALYDGRTIPYYSRASLIIICIPSLAYDGVVGSEVGRAGVDDGALSRLTVVKAIAMVPSSD